MATSGVSNFNPTFDDLLTDAAGMVGGDPILAEELSSAQRGMDYLLTQIQNRNVLLHKIETTVVPVAASVSAISFDNRILDVLSISSHVSAEQSTMNLARLGYESWATLPQRQQGGRPMQFWFDRELQGNTLHLWPFTNREYNLVLTVQKTTEDTIRAFGNVDVPRRFLPTLLFGLAYYVGLRRPATVDQNRLALLKTEYEANLKAAMREDRERTSYFMRIGRR